MQLVVIRGLIWLTTEVFLSMVQLDQLADYSEFIFRLKDDMALQQDKIVRLVSHDAGSPTFCNLQANG